MEGIYSKQAVQFLDIKQLAKERQSWHTSDIR